MASSTVHSVRLPTGDTPICGVTLEPYVLIKRGDVNIPAEDLPDEGQSDGPLQLRSRWFRSTITQGKAYCSVHPNKEAAVQCTVCLWSKVAQHLSYHCSADCFRSHWHLHRDYHKQAAANGTENGHERTTSFKGGSVLSNGENWVEVARTRKYTPTDDDVSYTLRYDCWLLDTSRGAPPEVGKPSQAFTTRVRPAPSPPQRKLVAISSAPVNHSTTGKFTLLTYNLLADLYAKNYDCGGCPAWAISWHYRKRNLLKELLNYMPDIMCLQEVQSDHYASFLQPELQKHGYMAIYKKKTTEMYTGNSYAMDGCATFYRRDKFQLVKKYEVEFNKAALSLSESLPPIQKKNALNRLLKDNVALIAVLEALDATPEAIARGGRQLICVANTHIHANPELNDVKLWQVHTLLKGLEKIANSADIPMLVAGDFNSTPGSAAHSLLVKQKVMSNSLDPSQDPLNIMKRHDMHHALPLASAYAAAARAPNHIDAGLPKLKQRLDRLHGEPLFTNLTKGFKGTLDYILYTVDSLAPLSLLELPTEADVQSRPDEVLPNASWSSDHIALMAEFQMFKG